MNLRPLLALLVMLPAVPIADGSHTCSYQHVHTYVGAAGVSVADVAVGIGFTTDPNVNDCNHDGIPADSDDQNLGVGAAFLPSDHHSASVCVEDIVVGATVAFTIGGSGPFVGCASTAEPPTCDVVFCSMYGWWVHILGPTLVNGQVSSTPVAGSVY